jgi:ubiquinone/menaquinone biosynthesis C-methylase UbiE
MEPNQRTFNHADAGRLEDPARLVWLPPDEVVAALELAPGMCVADVGAGTGYFALPMARAVAPSGVVKAVDFQPEMLALLRRKLEAEAAQANVETIHGSALATTLATASCDVLLLANVWHELDGHGAVLDEAKRVIRSGGRIAILDWRTDVSRPPGPPLEHRVPVQSVTAALTRDGWLAVAARNTGVHNYLAIATRP